MDKNFILARSADKLLWVLFETTDIDFIVQIKALLSVRNSSWVITNLRLVRQQNTPLKSCAVKVLIQGYS